MFLWECTLLFILGRFTQFKAKCARGSSCFLFLWLGGNALPVTVALLPEPTGVSVADDALLLVTGLIQSGGLRVRVFWPWQVRGSFVSFCIHYRDHSNPQRCLRLFAIFEHFQPVWLNVPEEKKKDTLVWFYHFLSKFQVYFYLPRVKILQRFYEVFIYVYNIIRNEDLCNMFSTYNFIRYRFQHK